MPVDAYSPTCGEYASPEPKRQALVGRLPMDTVMSSMLLSSAKSATPDGGAPMRMPSLVGWRNYREGSFEAFRLFRHPTGGKSSGRRGYFVSTIPGLTGKSTATQSSRAMAWPAAEYADEVPWYLRRDVCIEVM